MSVGFLEIVILFAAFLSLACALYFLRQWLSEHRWLMVVPLLLLTAALTTPADPFSTLIVAVPHILVFWGLSRWFMVSQQTT